ncbi:MAG: hypothetical protein WDA21_01710 [Bacilli bacterium]
MTINDMLYLIFNKKSGEAIDRRSLKTLLKNNKSEPIYQEYQDLIVTEYKELLPYIKGITGKTLINFCTTYKDDRKRGLLAKDVSILFDAYQKDIKPRQNDFIRDELTSELKKVLLDNISEDTVQCLAETPMYEGIKQLYTMIEEINPVKKDKAREKADDGLVI